MDKNLDKLPLIIDGKAVIAPCIEIMALSTVPKADGAAGYVRFYEAFMRRYGSAIRHYRLNDSRRWRAWQPKDRAKVPSWFADARTLAEPLLGITMHTHSPADEPRPPLFGMFFDHVSSERPRGMFQIVLPVDCIADGAAALLALVDDAMADFPVHWGTVGFAFHWDGNDTSIDRYADAWLGGHLLKHPGLAPGDLMSWGLRVEKGISNIGWLTFVGDALLPRLGGRASLAERLTGTGVELRSYAKGVALQAGDVPELGDVNRKNRLPKYCEVGRVLEPVFAPEDFLEKIRIPGIKDPDARLAWLRRFLP